MGSLAETILAEFSPPTVTLMSRKVKFCAIQIYTMAVPLKFAACAEDSWTENRARWENDQKLQETCVLFFQMWMATVYGRMVGQLP